MYFVLLTKLQIQVRFYTLNKNFDSPTQNRIQSIAVTATN